MSRTAYWITFTDARPACAWVESEDAARELAAARGTVKAITTLPYPSSPRLDDKEGWSADRCPSFCSADAICQGRSSCPQSYSCTE
jgi:hypothetical protein